MKSALLLCLGMLGCAGVCCGQDSEVYAKPWRLAAPTNGDYKSTYIACGLAKELYGIETQMRKDGCYVRGMLAEQKTALEPEPMDVPAIKTKKVLVHARGTSFECSVFMLCTAEQDEYTLNWICADKSRILLTAEDGTKHCIKFPK